MILLSNPTLLIKLICVGTASKSEYLSSKFYGFLSIGDPRQETIVEQLCFSAKSGYPPSKGIPSTPQHTDSTPAPWQQEFE